MTQPIGNPNLDNASKARAVHGDRTALRIALRLWGIDERDAQAWLTGPRSKPMQLDWRIARDRAAAGADIVVHVVRPAARRSDGFCWNCIGANGALNRSLDHAHTEIALFAGDARELPGSARATGPSRARSTSRRRSTRSTVPACVRRASARRTNHGAAGFARADRYAARCDGCVSRRESIVGRRKPRPGLRRSASAKYGIRNITTGVTTNRQMASMVSRIRTPSVRIGIDNIRSPTTGHHACCHSTRIFAPLPARSATAEIKMT